MTESSSSSAQGRFRASLDCLSSAFMDGSSGSGNLRLLLVGFSLGLRKIESLLSLFSSWAEEEEAGEGDAEEKEMDVESAALRWRWRDLGGVGGWGRGKGARWDFIWPPRALPLAKVREQSLHRSLSIETESTASVSKGDQGS
ncbi:hypothetical protein SAY86_028105 [Trapa natans]|uniref:Uncharacterized protein n=1 Tax=Trapa natans TaxID=22666 RepID=A0AAN7M1R1_TRANT|nr:hypothetical protein SAY86_028105 [Trapa natans]